MDTEYGGFVVLPDAVYRLLGMDELPQERRTLIVVNGNRVSSKGTFSVLRLLDTGTSVDGLVETIPGTEEILIGTAALGSLRVELDYCLRRVSAERCR